MVSGSVLFFLPALGIQALLVSSGLGFSHFGAIILR